MKKFSPAFDKRRKRRIIYNDDCGQLYNATETDVVDDQSFLDSRTTPLFGTHVDTYAWCVGNGADPPYNRGSSNQPFLSCLGSEWRAADLIIEACHAHDVEVWASLRMNDIHDSFMADTLETTNDPMKAKHPEWLIGTLKDRDKLAEALIERSLWSAFNFEHKEVRNHRLNFIKKNAANHDFDGYELDFTRFVWDFPLGREIELAPLMTDLVRQIRKLLNQIGERRGRPYTLVVHVLDSPEKSLLLGQDVEAWLKEGLIDVLIVGMGYLPYALRLDQWKTLGDQYEVPVYPSLNANTFIHPLNDLTKRFNRISAYYEAIRAAAAWWLYGGADGIYAFNLFDDMSDNGTKTKALISQVLTEVGDVAVLADKDKIYGIGSANRGGFCHHGCETSPLPTPLGKIERKLPLTIGPDADKPNVQFTVHFWSTGGNDNTQVYMRVNHKLLQPIKTGDASEGWRHYIAKVDTKQMRAGVNELSLWCNLDITEMPTPLIVHEVLVEAKHGM